MLKIIVVFFDRLFIGEDVIYCEEVNDVYYLLYCIISIMINKGFFEFGVLIGKIGCVIIIVDCMCRDNKIFYEWLMWDNSFFIV